MKRIIIGEPTKYEEMVLKYYEKFKEEYVSLEKTEEEQILEIEYLIKNNKKQKGLKLYKNGIPIIY